MEPRISHLQQLLVKIYGVESSKFPSAKRVLNSIRCVQNLELDGKAESEVMAQIALYALGLVMPDPSEKANFDDLYRMVVNHGKSTNVLKARLPGFVAFSEEELVEAGNGVMKEFSLGSFSVVDRSEGVVRLCSPVFRLASGLKQRLVLTAKTDGASSISAHLFLGTQDSDALDISLQTLFFRGPWLPAERNTEATREDLVRSMREPISLLSLSCSQ